MFRLVILTGGVLLVTAIEIRADDAPADAPRYSTGFTNAARIYER